MKNLACISLSVMLLMTCALPAFTQNETGAATATAPAATQSDSGIQTTTPALTNKDVLEMMKAGLASEIIIAKIKASPTSFDTTPAALQELKTAGLADAVILAMVQAPTGGDASNVSTAASNFPGVEIRVPDGTPLEVELLTSVSSNTAKEGDIIDFTVVSPVVVGGVTIIEKGAPAKARVAAVKKAGYWGKAGRIGWAMQDVLTVDGNRIPLRMEKKLTGDSKGGTVATATIVTAVVFWPAAPFWGLKKGKNAVFPAGRRFEAFVHGDVTVRGRPGSAGPTAQPAATTDAQATPAKP